jgi:hypothetical protein
LAGNFFTKSISEASLLQKDTESAAASPEHKRAHNQQRVHRHIPRSKEQGAKNGFAARFAPCPYSRFGESGDPNVSIELRSVMNKQ